MDFVIESRHPSFSKTGLKYRSVLRCHKLALLDKMLVARVIGEIDEVLMKEVNHRLLLALGLSVSTCDIWKARRDKLLAESFYLMGDIEKYGTGFIRIRKMLRDYPGVFYSISEPGDFFKIEMRHTPAKYPIKAKADLPKNLPWNLPKNLLATHKQIIENMLMNPKITYNEFADITGKTRKTIRVHIKMLKEMKLIKRIGPPFTHWMLFLINVMPWFFKAKG